MFGALRDCVPQLRQACHEEEDDKMVADFKNEIMDVLKEVSQEFNLLFPNFL